VCVKVGDALCASCAGGAGAQVSALRLGQQGGMGARYMLDMLVVRARKWMRFGWVSSG